MKIPQKSLDYRPTDKLAFATIGFIAGAETVYDINQTLRPNRQLLKAFGYEKCANQSVIQQTINAATETNVTQLEQALNQIWRENNQTILFLDENPEERKLVKIYSGKRAKKLAKSVSEWVAAETDNTKREAGFVKRFRISD